MLKIFTDLFEQKFADTYKPDEGELIRSSDPLNRLSPVDIGNLIGAYAQPGLLEQVRLKKRKFEAAPADDVQLSLLEQVLLKKRKIQTIPVDDIHILMRDMSKEDNFCVYNPDHKFRPIVERIHDYFTQANMGPELIDFLKEILPEWKVIDWGSAKGYCSYVLRKRNVETVAIDIECYKNSFINDTKIVENSFPFVEQLATEGYALLMSRPEPNNAPNQALEAYENGKGECVIVLGIDREVADGTFWQRISNPNTWCQIPIPKEAQPYGAGLACQYMQVYKSAYGLCKQKVDPANPASIMVGLRALLAYFELAHYYDRYNEYLDIHDNQYSWKSFLEALKAYPASDLHCIYQKFHAVTYKVAAKPLLQQAIAIMLGNLNDMGVKAVQPALDMLVAHDQEDPIKTLVDIERIFLHSTSLSECLEKLSLT